MPNSYIRSRKAELVRQFAIERNRTPVSDTWFSLPLRDTGIAEIDVVRDSDIIHVHWCSGLLSLNGLDELFSLGKPVVLTLHDQWAFTGGCHYSAGCDGFRTGCETCPQLDRDPVGVPAVTLRLRRQMALSRRGTVVSPSRWMLRTASESPVFSGWNHEHVPNAIDTDVFKPQARSDARRALNLAPDPWWILFVSERVAERRKGFADVLRVASRLESVAGRPIRFLALGAPIELPPELSGRFEFTGKLDQESRIVAAYSAADALLLPSYEDNLPNTMVEAIACGTPVVGFETGGIPDLVLPGISGLIVPTGDAEGLAGALAEILASCPSESLRESCRALAVRTCSYEAHARQCVALYQRLLAEPATHTAPAQDYDTPLWDAAIDLLRDRLELRPDFTQSEKIAIMAAWLEINRLLDSQAANPVTNRWNWA